MNESEIKVMFQDLEQRVTALEKNSLVTIDVDSILESEK
jgi:hypothetical protein